MKERFIVKKEDLGELKTASILASEHSVGKYSKQLIVTVDYITREVKFNVVINKESILETLELDEAIMKFNLV